MFTRGTRFWHTAISSLKNHMTIQVWGTLWPYGLAWFPGSAGVFRRQFDPDGTSKAQHWMILDHYFKNHGQNDRVECVELKHQVSCISIPHSPRHRGLSPSARSNNLLFQFGLRRWDLAAMLLKLPLKIWELPKKTANLVNFQLADTCGPASPEQEQKPK